MRIFEVINKQLAAFILLLELNSQRIVQWHKIHFKKAVIKSTLDTI